jgi:hypothetical protein
MGSAVLEAVREAGEGFQARTGFFYIVAKGKKEFEDEAKVFKLESTAAGPGMGEKGLVIQLEFAGFVDLDSALEGWDGAKAKLFSQRGRLAADRAARIENNGCPLL